MAPKEGNMTSWKLLSGVAVAVLLSCTVASAQATSTEYKVTVKSVVTGDALRFVGVQKNRTDKVPNGKVFLIVDLAIEMADPQLRPKFEGKSILNFLTVTSNSGEVFVASGGGFDPDHTCSGDDCGVYISKTNPPIDTPNRKEESVVLFYCGAQMEIKYPPAKTLFDGRLVFTITKELVAQPLKLQFQGIQLSIVSK